MILDLLENASRYQSLHPGFKAAFDFLHTADFEQLSDGRHEIDGDRVFVVIARGQGRGRAGAKLEAHRRYIDIQFAVEGTDEVGWKPTVQCDQPESDFDESNDVILYRDPSVLWTPLSGTAFAIYYPEDAHAPMAGEGTLRKAVAKILIA